jgi:hypothetical protein
VKEEEDGKREKDACRKTKAKHTNPFTEDKTEANQLPASTYALQSFPTLAHAS